MGGQVTAADQSPLASASVRTWRQCPLCFYPWCSDLAWGKTVSLHLKDGQCCGTGPANMHGALSPKQVLAGVATCICVFCCIYLFVWLIDWGLNSQASYVSSWKRGGKEGGRKREKRGCVWERVGRKKGKRKQMSPVFNLANTLSNCKSG